MSVVTGKSNLIHDPYDPTSLPPDPVLARGIVKVQTGKVVNAADDSSASMWHLFDIPSHAILLPATFFDVQADGFAQIVIGTFDDTDALVDVAKSAGNIHSPVAQGDAKHGKRIWEIIGLAADPGGMVSIYKHAEANATGAGSTEFQIHYVDNS